MARFVRYQDYASLLLAQSEVEERLFEHAIRESEAIHLVKAWTGKSSDRVTIAKAEAALDPKVRALQGELDVVYARRKLQGVMYETIDRDARLLSRELSRRIGREPTERRVDRFTP